MVEYTKDNVREKTLEDLKDKLYKYHKCALIRPTGFGKTWMLTSLIREYKNVLYFYPADVIKNTVIDRWISEDEDIDEETIETIKEVGNLPNCTLMSYMKLIRLSDNEIKDMSNYDLIVMDEVHRVGGTRTKESVYKLFQYVDKVDFVGATATPNRSDGFDVVSEFFDNITVFPFTLHDAFECNILHRPYYCYCTYDIETDLKEAALTAGEDINNLRVREVLDRKLIEISKIYNIPSILKKTLNKYSGKGTYKKFIVFFHGIDHLENKKDTVIEWFREAYPSYSVRTLEISSVNKEMSSNVNRLGEYTKKSKTIDLILCVDMLNMGYHVDDLTGIIMYRGTHSDIIYIQQLGRALSSGSDKSCVVFDIVDNLHRKALFDYSEPANRCNNPLRENRGDVSESTGQSVDEFDSDSVDVSNKDDWYFVDESGNKKFKWWKTSSSLVPEDLYATGNEASYRELIAKTVAEPMTQRCEEAFEAHFRRWCRNNNIEYPVSDNDLEKLYGRSKKEFVEYFKEVVSSNGLDYPMNDARKLLEIGTKRPDGIPMEIFARWKNTSVRNILDLLGIAS